MKICYLILKSSLPLSTWLSHQGQWFQEHFLLWKNLGSFWREDHLFRYREYHYYDRSPYIVKMATSYCDGRLNFRSMSTFMGCELWLTCNASKKNLASNRPRNYLDHSWWVIWTHHDWPSQMHENLLISRVKTRVIASVFTLHINKFECICEGHAWWVCII